MSWVGSFKSGNLGELEHDLVGISGIREGISTFSIRIRVCDDESIKRSCVHSCCRKGYPLVGRIIKDVGAVAEPALWVCILVWYDCLGYRLWSWYIWRPSRSHIWHVGLLVNCERVRVTGMSDRDWENPFHCRCSWVYSQRVCESYLNFVSHRLLVDNLSLVNTQLSCCCIESCCWDPRVIRCSSSGSLIWPEVCYVGPCVELWNNWTVCIRLNSRNQRSAVYLCVSDCVREAIHWSANSCVC